MIGTGRSWIDDSDGNRFAALASQLITVNRNSSYDINEREHIGSHSTIEYLSISFVDSSKIFLFGVNGILFRYSRGRMSDTHSYPCAIARCSWSF
jgi:hypothetical protein